jgi:hypothetical protein
MLSASLTLRRISLDERRSRIRCGFAAGQLVSRKNVNRDVSQNHKAFMHFHIGANGHHGSNFANMFKVPNEVQTAWNDDAS